MTSTKTLKSQASKGVFWNGIDQITVTLGRFVVNIVLARLLFPEDFGLVGMLAIFISLSEAFINSGMASGLIQKQDKTDDDYSTVFIFNFGISVLFYILLFFSAPWIAVFYEKPELIPLTRILGGVIIINSLAIVQRTKLEIEVDFRKLAVINIIALIISGSIAIYTAYQDYGVWALVINTLVNSLIAAIGLWLIGNWKFSLKFSKTSFRNLFGFGSRLLAAGIYARFLQEIYTIIIGKIYTATELGFYVNAKKYADISSGTLTSVMQKVTYPVLARLRGEQDRMVKAYRKILKMTAFIVFPAMILLALVAKPLVILLLTEKWLPTVPLLQWLCIARIVYPISGINMNILNAVGRSDLYLKVDLVKFPFILGALLITAPISVKAMVIGQTVVSLLSFFINAYMPGKLFGHGPFGQLNDFKYTFLSTGGMATCTFLIMQITDNLWGQLILGVTTGMISYLLISYILKMDELREMITQGKQFVFDRKP